MQRSKSVQVVLSDLKLASDTAGCCLMNAKRGITCRIMATGLDKGFGDSTDELKAWRDAGAGHDEHYESSR